MDNRIIRFAVDDNTNFYKIELSRTLLHFAEFDFTYFWEQCIEAGKAARKSGRLPQNIINAAKTVIGRAHPYIEACINTDYSEIVTDCIIEYICHSERIGLEELWARCISPKNLYEGAIFRRISEYKTNRAMNRWTSIVRLQEYTRNKMDFVFGTDTAGIILNKETIRARKEYFDLMLSVAANELGCPAGALPSVKVCTPATLPNAAFAVSKVSKAIYRRFSDTLAEGRDMSSLENRDCSKIGDQLAMEAYSYVKTSVRPGDIEMNFALEAIRETPEELYLPDSLKAVIDLEFEMMLKEGMALRKCESCGRYFAASEDDPNTRCDRVNSSGKTCRRQYDDLVETIASEARSGSSEGEYEEITFDGTPIVIPPRPQRDPVKVPPEMEKRAQKMYNALYKRLGKGIDENEFKEWSLYLSNMKRNLKLGEATLKQYEEFLDYSEKLSIEVKIASKNKMPHAPVEKTYEHNIPAAVSGDAADTAAVSGTETDGGYGEEEYEERPQSVLSEQDDSDEPHVPQVEAAVVRSSDDMDAKVKPFVPQAFDSVFDAMIAGVADEMDEEEAVREKKPPEIKEPKWERLSREDAYGTKE